MVIIGQLQENIISGHGGYGSIVSASLSLTAALSSALFI